MKWNETECKKHMIHNVRFYLERNHKKTQQRRKKTFSKTNKPKSIRRGHSFDLLLIGFGFEGGFSSGSILTYEELF